MSKKESSLQFTIKRVTTFDDEQNVSPKKQDSSGLILAVVYAIMGAVAIGTTYVTINFFF